MISVYHSLLYINAFSIDYWKIWIENSHHLPVSPDSSGPIAYRLSPLPTPRSQLRQLSHIIETDPVTFLSITFRQRGNNLPLFLLNPFFPQRELLIFIP